MKLTLYSEKDANLKIDLEGDLVEKTIFHNMSTVRSLAGAGHVFHNGSYENYTLTIKKLHRDKKKDLQRIILTLVSISTNNRENHIGLAMTNPEIEWTRVDEYNYSCVLTFTNKILTINT